ncbi:MAG: DUF2202 domain-containing protein [Nitrospirae bacterium]|nr:DUF2202 domain-containing protein [Fimbriimonadaceae bacterium]
MITPLIATLALTFALGGDAKSALTESLMDEYRAHATYTAVIGKFGAFRPFSNIVRAEEMHISLVQAEMRVHGLAVPPNPFARKEDESSEEHAKRLGVPATRLDAAKDALKLERDQGPLYDKLTTPDLPESVRSLFARLKRDSIERHLVAFERYVGRG